MGQGRDQASGIPWTLSLRHRALRLALRPGAAGRLGWELQPL